MEKMSEKEMSYLKDQHDIALKDLNRRLEESSSKRSDEEDMEMLRLELEEQRNVLESTLSKKMELENELNRKTRELDSKENALNESSKRVSEMQLMLNESSKKSEVETESLREAFLEEQQKRAQQAEQLESLQEKWHEAENELHRLSSELEVATKKEQSAVESSSILQDTLESVRFCFDFLFFLCRWCSRSPENAHTNTRIGTRRIELTSRSSRSSSDTQRCIAFSSRQGYRS